MWLPGKRRPWKYYAIRKRSHNYGAFAPFFIGTEHSFAGPDTGRTLLVRPVHISVKQKIPQKWGIFCLIWWPWSDSNRHSLQNLILSQARLPIPPRGQKAAQQIILLRLYGQQPFSPGAHCDLPCALVFWLVFQLCPIFY